MSESEADLLEELLGVLDDPHMQFKLGKLMGIMSKVDRDHISRLQHQAEQFLDQVKCLNRSLDAAEQELKELREQDSQS